MICNEAKFSPTHISLMGVFLKNFKPVAQYRLSVLFEILDVCINPWHGPTRKPGHIIIIWYVFQNALIKHTPKGTYC